MAVGMAPRTTFGGAIPAEVDFLAFSDLAQAKSWVMTPSRAEVQAVMAEVGAANAVLALYFRPPSVLDEASGLRKAGAILGLFGAPMRPSRMWSRASSSLRASFPLPAPRWRTPSAVRRPTHRATTLRIRFIPSDAARPIDAMSPVRTPRGRGSGQPELTPSGRGAHPCPWRRRWESRCRF